MDRTDLAEAVDEIIRTATNVLTAWGTHMQEETPVLVHDMRIALARLREIWPPCRWCDTHHPGGPEHCPRADLRTYPIDPRDLPDEEAQS